MLSHRARQPLQVASSSAPAIKRDPIRLIIAFDGTYKNSVVEPNKVKWTNVRHLFDALNPAGADGILQLKLYVAGVGTSGALVLDGVRAALGLGMLDSVRTSYDWLSNNYQVGDEVYFIGFSRGSYTARMLSNFVGIMGIIPLRELPNLPDLFATLTAHPKATATQPDVLAALGPHLARKAKQDRDRGSIFSIQGLLLFDTVSAEGVPHFSSPKPGHPVPPSHDHFGLDDTELRSHVAHAFHALALDEHRLSFSPVLLKQTPFSRAQGQTLIQMWFSGSHGDVGGGHKKHDLSLISLWWMVAQTENLLSYDMEFLASLCSDVQFGWGTSPPIISRKAIYRGQRPLNRPVPTQFDPLMEQFVHESVVHRHQLRPEVEYLLQHHPELVAPLEPREKAFALCWPARPNPTAALAQSDSDSSGSDFDGAVHALNLRIRADTPFVVGPSQQSRRFGQLEGRLKDKFR